MKKSLYIFAFLICSLSAAFGQNIQTIDELIAKTNAYINTKIDSAIILAHQVVDLSEEMNYIQGKSRGLSFLGFASYVKGDYENAIKYCEQSISFGEKVNETQGLKMAYNALGLVYMSLGKDDEAILLFNKLINVSTESNDLYNLSDGLSNLGLVYLNQKNYQKAYQYLPAAIDLYQQIDHPHGRVYANLNYGRLFYEQNEYDSAFHYLEIAYDLAKQLENERALIHINSMLGQMSLNRNQPDLAEQYFLEAYELSNKLNLEWGKTEISSWLCETYYKKQNYKKAIEYGNIAIKLAKETRKIYIIHRVNNIIAKSFLETKNIDAAENHVQYMEHLIDSLALLDTTSLTNSAIEIGIIKEEEQNLELVSHQLAVAKAEIARRNLLLIGTVITSFLLAAILALIVKSNKVKTRTNKELRALNQKINAQKENLEEAIKALDASNKEKDLLVGMVAHDIRSPLNKISGLINILQIQKELDDGQMEVCGMVQRTINDANKLADELLEINKIESGALDKTHDTLKLSEFIKHVNEHFKPIADSKNIELVIDQKCSDRQFTTDKKLLQRIFENLLSNAIKFSQKSTTVTIEIVCLGGKIKFNVIDQGEGIPEEEQKYLFTKFGKTSTRPTNGEPSNGLGLYIVNQLTKTLGGDLDFTSQVGKGSQFAILLPLN